MREGKETLTHVAGSVYLLRDLFVNSVISGIVGEAPKAKRFHELLSRFLGEVAGHLHESLNHLAAIGTATRLAHVLLRGEGVSLLMASLIPFLTPLSGALGVGTPEGLGTNEVVEQAEVDDEACSEHEADPDVAHGEVDALQGEDRMTNDGDEHAYGDDRAWELEAEASSATEPAMK